jgi:hypothetical protein
LDADAARVIRAFIRTVAVRAYMTAPGGVNELTLASALLEHATNPAVPQEEREKASREMARLARAKGFLGGRVSTPPAPVVRGPASSKGNRYSVPEVFAAIKEVANRLGVPVDRLPGTGTNGLSYEENRTEAQPSYRTIAGMSEPKKTYRDRKQVWKRKGENAWRTAIREGHKARAF